MAHKGPTGRLKQSDTRVGDPSTSTGLVKYPVLPILVPTIVRSVPTSIHFRTSKTNLPVTARQKVEWPRNALARYPWHTSQRKPPTADRSETCGAHAVSTASAAHAGHTTKHISTTENEPQWNLHDESQRIARATKQQRAQRSLSN